MNEGISVYSQSRRSTARPLRSRAPSETTACSSFKELNSSASGSVASTVGLFYAQSGSIIKFLVDTYGAEKFGDLIKIFKDGSTPDKAFEAVYGFDQLGMENAWRASVGLGARSASATATPQADAGSASPPSRPPPRRQRRRRRSDGGTRVVTIAIIVVLALLLLAVIAAAAMVVRRRL